MEKFPSLKIKLEGSKDKLYAQFTDYQWLQDSLAGDYKLIDHVAPLKETSKAVMGFHFNLLFNIVKY